MIKSVIFDMDGLMLDTKPLWVEANTRMLELYNVVFEPAIEKQLSGLKTPDVMALLKSTYNLQATIEDLSATRDREVTQMLNSNYPIVAKPGLYQLLDLLDQHNFSKAVATSTYSQYAIRMLDTVGVLNRFSVIVYGEQVPRGKPAPDIFLKAAEILNTPPVECLVLEDAVAGIKAAKNAGMFAIAIPSSDNFTDFNQADLTLNSLSDITLETITNIA